MTTRLSITADKPWRAASKTWPAGEGSFGR